jgi:biopolymer transport protein ExbB
MLAFIAKGGPLVAGLTTLSILVISIVIERYWVMRLARGKISPDKFLKQLRPLIEKNDIESIEGLSNQQKGLYGRIVNSLVRKLRTLPSTMNKEAIKDELLQKSEEVTTMESSLLERHLIAIATIGSIATMMGLLGTVIGMIRSFAALSMDTAAGVASQQLAIGIAEALVNTAGGLTVAIMSIIFYNYFLNKIDVFKFEVEEITKVFVYEITEHY